MELRLHERDAELADVEAALGAASARARRDDPARGPGGDRQVLAARRGPRGGAGPRPGRRRRARLGPRDRLRLGHRAPAARAAAAGDARRVAPARARRRGGAGRARRPARRGRRRGRGRDRVRRAPRALLARREPGGGPAAAARRRRPAVGGRRVGPVPRLPGEPASTSCRCSCSRRQRPGAAPLATAAVRRLAPLSAGGTAAVLAEAGGDGDGVPAASPPPATTRPGGNPLLVRRLAAELPARRRRRGARRAGGAHRPRGAGGRRRRHDRAPRARSPPGWPRAVAVLDRAPLAMAARIAGRSRTARRSRSGSCVAGILRDARPLEFAHALVRDAVLSGHDRGGARPRPRRGGGPAPRGGRPGRGGRSHLLHTEPRGDPAAAAVLTEAGRRALASGAPAEAAAILERALAEPPPAAERPRLLLDLARAEHGTGAARRSTAIAEAFDVAEDAGRPRRRRARLVWAGGPGQQAPERDAGDVRGRARGRRRARPRAASCGWSRCA